MIPPATRLIYKYLRSEYESLDKAQNFFLGSIIALVLLAAGSQFFQNKSIFLMICGAGFTIFNSYLVLQSVAMQLLLMKILPEYEQMKSGRDQDEKKKAEATASAI